MLSIEAFVIINFTMNLLVLGVGARGSGHVRWRRMIMASLMGTIYAVAAYAGTPGLRGFAAQTACLLLMSLVLSGRSKNSGKRMLRRLWHTACWCMFAGGVMTWLARRIPHGNPLPTAAGWLIVAACAFFSDVFRAEGTRQGSVLMRIGTRMGTAEIEALVDTGNRLHEPLSGLPVIVVGQKQLRGLLDESCLQRPPGRLLPGFRIVRYGALGGFGEMYCFRPESVCVWMKGRWEEGPDLWVAIYPGDIPSGVEALAPPVF